MDALPEISLGTAALIIFAICAGYMFIRGLARTLVNSAMLVASAWVGFRVWEEAPSLAIDWFGKPSELIATGLPVLAFIITFLVLRKIIKFFRAPIPKSTQDTAPKSAGQLVFRLFITLIPAALLCLTVATVVHHVSSVAEIRDSVENGDAADAGQGLAARLKDSIAAAIPQSLLEKLDPLASPQRLQLAKMIAASSEKTLEPVIDPETGRPYPRAIIVDDPELVELAKERRFSTLLRHPLLSEALKDPLVRQRLGF